MIEDPTQKMAKTDLLALTVCLDKEDHRDRLGHKGHEETRETKAKLGNRDLMAMTV